MLDGDVLGGIGSISQPLRTSFLTLNQGPFAPRSLLASTLQRTSPPPEPARPVPRGLPVGGLSPRSLGLPVLTLPSFAHMPAPIPRCFCLVLLLLASQSDGGLRLIRTGSAVTLPVSRLARHSIFILACMLVDPLSGSFAPEASCPTVTGSSRSGYFRLEQQLPGGLASSHWKSAFFPRRTRNAGYVGLKLT